MSVRYLDLADYIEIASEVTGLDYSTVVAMANLDLADSALHAPAAGFGKTDIYPEFVEKCAVLIVRLARNHPLPDGNKRVAWDAVVRRTPGMVAVANRLDRLRKWLPCGVVVIFPSLITWK